MTVRKGRYRSQYALTHASHSAPSHTVWDETTFQSSRNTNLERVTEYINRIARNCENDCDTLPEVVVVDDLMYLRSMRREIYVLGRDRNVPILVVWVKTDIEVALERNSRREGRLCIAESTVRKIAEHLQPPDPALIFDRNSITIDGNGPVDMSVNLLVELISRSGA